MTDDICPICKRAKASIGSGSITQWIVACQCGIQDTDDDKHSDQIQLCRTCGKRMDEGRLGSITQFIFRSDSCRCKIQKSLEQALKESALLTPVHSERKPIEEVEEEPELEVDKDGFPTERYKPLVQLGSGASGVVFLASDRILKKKVAIKILRVMDPKAVISFQEEARTTSKLKHKYIVALLDFGVTPGGSPYMVLEYVVGLSLEETIGRVGSLNLPDFFSVFHRVCEALAYAHRNSVFHRDLKPGNILLTNDSDGRFEVRVIDFGLSKILSDNLEHNSNKGITLAGTPTYMSPDQGLGRPFDARSEVYSLGCVMFEALTGNAPFESEGALELLALHAKKIPPSLAETAGQAPNVAQQKTFPAELEELIQICLAKNPDERYQSMDELIEALKIVETAFSEEPIRENDNYTESQSTNRTGRWMLTGMTITGLLCALWAYFEWTRMNDSQVKPEGKHDSPDTVMRVRPTFTERITSLRRLVDPDAEIVNISAGLGDEQFKELRLFKNARELDISNNLISDEAISYINSPNLQTLRLNNTNVSSLKHVAKLKSLTRLDVGGSSVNGDALKVLKSLPNLEELGIRNTELRDEDLDKLRDVKTLTRVDYQKGNFSEEALDKICKEMPGCRFGQKQNKIPFKDPTNMISTNQYKKSLPKISESISIIAAVQGPEAPLLANYYFFQGLAFYKEDQINEAKVSFERSSHISERTGYTHYLPDVQSYMRAIAARERGSKNSKSASTKSGTK